MLVNIGNYALVDGTRSGGVGATGLRFRVQREIQVQKVFRAAQVSTFDRGNRETTASFEVVRTFGTLDEADVFILEHEDDVPSTGLVYFTAVKPNGQRVVRWLANGKIQSHELVTQIGVTVRHQYVIVGGEVTAKQPTS